MDRELIVLKDGYELATLSYSYDRPNSGKVKIKMNRIYDLGDDSKSTYPIFELEQYFNHHAITTIQGFKEYDRNFLKQQPDIASESAANLQFNYEPVVFRYLITHRDTVGIAEINSNFTENTKELKFLSARRQKEDLALTSNSFQSNHELLKDLCETYLDCYGTDFKRIEWN